MSSSSRISTAASTSSSTNSAIIEQICDPTIPHVSQIPGGYCRVGRKFVISGVMTGNEFKISLLKENDAALIFTADLDDRLIRMNSSEGGKLGMEKCTKVFPFNLGKQFTVEIACVKDGYRISVNEVECMFMRHRHVLEHVKKIHVDGCAKVTSIAIY